MRNGDTPATAARRLLRSAADTMSAWHGALRLLVAAPALYAAGFVVLVAGFLSMVSIAGCFLACSDPQPQPALGAGLLLLAGAAVAAVVGMLTWVMSPPRARAVPLRSHALAAVVAAPAVGLAIGWEEVMAGPSWRTAAWLATAAVLAVIAVARRTLVKVPSALLHAIEDMPQRLRTALALLVAAAGLLWITLVASTPSCSFAGVRCPNPDPGPLMAGGWTLAAAVAVVLLTGHRRRSVAWLVVAAVGLAAGLVGA